MVRNLSEICGLHSVSNLTAYIGLFLVAFGAATVLPFQSEPVLVGLLVSGKFSVYYLIIVASVGNILGAVCNWVLGRFIDRFQDRAWFPVRNPRWKEPVVGIGGMADGRYSCPGCPCSEMR